MRARGLNMKVIIAISFICVQFWDVALVVIQLVISIKTTAQNPSFLSLLDSGLHMHKIILDMSISGIMNQ